MDIHIHGNPGSAAGRKFFGPSYYRLCDMNCSKVRIHLPEVYWLESLTQNVYVCSASKRKWSATPHRRRDCFISPIWTRWLHLTWQPYRQLLVSTYLMTGRWFTSSKYKEINFGRLVAPIYGKFGTLVRLALQNLTLIGSTGWVRGPKYIKNFHFLVKIRSAAANPFTDF